MVHEGDSAYFSGLLEIFAMFKLYNFLNPLNSEISFETENTVVKEVLEFKAIFFKITVEKVTLSILITVLQEFWWPFKQFLNYIILVLFMLFEKILVNTPILQL